jgi:hypothetical protein
MSSTNTEYEFTSSLKKDSNIYICKDRQYIYYNDLANGAYNTNTSEVKFELISLANTNQFVNWAESFILIPLTLSVKATVGTFNGTLGLGITENAFALSLKNGYQHIVDSLLITVNDNPVNQPCQGANIPNTFRLYEMSADDRNTLGDMINFYLDTGDSIRYLPTPTTGSTFQVGPCAISSITTAGVVTCPAGTFSAQVGQQFILGGVTYTIQTITSATTYTVLPLPQTAITTASIVSWLTPLSLTNAGLGETNNIISKASSLFNPSQGFLTNIINEGRQKRTMNTSYDPSQTSISNYFTNISKTGDAFRNSLITNSSTEITYNIFATIPMSVLHDFFDKLPITRGLSVRLNLYLNTGITIVENVNGAQHLNIVSYTMPRQTCPFMVSPIANDPLVGSGFRILSDCSQVSYNLKIGNTTQPNCRFYASMYSFNPQTEALYISAPDRNILYNDIVQYVIPNVGYNQSVNNLITSGISRLRGLLLVPIISGASNQCNGLDAKQSPFSSCPATVFPYAKITNFQIQISGKPIYNTPLSHTFMFYNTALKPELSINGGSLRSLGMSSGCISKSDFENGYGFYYVDLTNIESEAEDNASKSVQVLFQNNVVSGTNNLAIDYYIYLYFQKQVAINISNGAFIKLE